MKNSCVKIYRQSHGAALIIAMLVVTAVSSIAFYASRLTIKELVVMNRQEDSLNAYYLAETGIEEGLMLWRYNHDVEISYRCQTSGDCQTPPTKNTDDPVNIDLGYKLKIWHRNDAGSPEQGTIDQDASFEYDISGLNNLAITCTAGCVDTPGNTYLQALEYFVVDRFNNVGDKGMIVPASGGLTRNISTANAQKLRLRAWGSSKNYTLTAGGGRLDSRYTTIESTGVFGNTQRKLQVKIDRQSGKTLGIFDFMLFGGTEINISGTSGPTPPPPPPPTSSYSSVYTNNVAGESGVQACIKLNAVCTEVFDWSGKDYSCDQSMSSAGYGIQCIKTGIGQSIYVNNNAGESGEQTCSRNSSICANVWDATGMNYICSQSLSSAGYAVQCVKGATGTAYNTNNVASETPEQACKRSDSNGACTNAWDWAGVNHSCTNANDAFSSAGYAVQCIKP